MSDVAVEPLELERWRADTPATLNGLIHLNNAGAALMPRPVESVVHEHLRQEAMRGGYEAAELAADAIADAYDAVARLIGAAARNIAVVENATVGFAQALSAFDFQPGDVILTTRNDYISNQLTFLSLARRLGVRVERADELPEGGVDPESVRARIRQRRPKLVTTTWVPTNSGLVQPVAELAAICRDADVPFVIDACQAVGQLPIDVADLGCDFLSGTARKFLRGPRGVGFLYVSDAMLEAGVHPLFIDMRGAEWIAADQYRLYPGARRFENWEFAYALLLGMGEAARYAAAQDVARCARRAWELAAYAREQLARIDGVRVLDRGAVLCAIVTAEVRGRSGPEIVRELRELGINATATGRDVAVIDMDAKAAPSAVRISPHYYNTRREIDIAVGAIEAMTQE